MNEQNTLAEVTPEEISATIAEAERACAEASVAQEGS